jgi:hypothetical protein
MQNDREDKIARQMVMKQSQLKMMDYMKKESELPVEGEMPNCFACTLFHVVFMYPTNVTVVSKISQQIVCSYNYKDAKLLRGI